MDAREKAVHTYNEIKTKDPELDLLYFDDLSRVADAHFIREYVWVYLRQPMWSEPSGLHLQHFQQWRGANLKDHQPQTQGSIATVAE